MLRIGFLKSDFNPMLLILGEQEDLRALGGVLRRFEREAADVRLDKLPFCGPTSTTVVLTASGGPAGISTAADGEIAWRVDPARAAGFAALADALADPTRLAGSEMLECGTADEIPVKLSRGEYTDEFLLPPTQ